MISSGHVLEKWNRCVLPSPPRASGPVCPGVQKPLQMWEFHEAIELSFLVCFVQTCLEPWYRTPCVSPASSVRNPWNSSCSLFWAPLQVGTLDTIQSWITALWNKVKRISCRNWNTCGLLSITAIETGLGSSCPWAVIHYRLSPESNPWVLLLVWGNSEPQLLPALLDDDWYKKDSCDTHYTSVIHGPRSWLLVQTYSTACFLWKMQNYGPGHLQIIIWVRSYYTYPGIFHNNAYFQIDFLPLVREEKLWDFNDSFYWENWIFVVVLTIKTYRGWNLAREKKAISFISFYFLTLHGAVAGEYFHPYYNKHFPEQQWGTEICKLEEKQDGSQKSEMNIEVSFLIWYKCLVSYLLSIYAIIVKAI